MTPILVFFAFGALVNVALAVLIFRKAVKSIRREQRDRRVIAELNRRRWVFDREIEVRGGSGASRTGPRQ